MADEQMKLGVAIVGCGTVGGATATILSRDAGILRERLVPELELKYIVDIDFAVARNCGLDESLFCDDLDKALADDSVGVIVELVGGVTFAKEVVERAVRAGKHVVTANKALLAYHGDELYALARDNGVCIGFEASCAGGIPIIRAICDGLVSNRIDALYGIVNGTCNYILTEMTQKGQSYADALAEAKADGLAEADPTLDVGGGDSAHKLTIMAALAFGRKIDFDSIPVAGIDSLELCDVQYGRELGYVVKLLAIAEHQTGGVSLRVRPAFLPMSHPLAWVSGPFNAVSVFGHAAGHTMYYGRGAGGMPTASAVVSDIAAIAMGTAQATFTQLRIWPDLSQQANQLTSDEIRSRYYIRVTVEDTPGVLAKMATVLGDNDISIRSVLQHELTSPCGDAVPVVITTHEAIEGNVRKAIEQIDAMNTTKAKTVCIDIVEEYPEALD